MRYTLFILFALLSLNACCPKVNCDIAMPAFSVSYYGYTKEEADTLTVYISAKDNNFTAPHTTLQVYAASETEPFVFYPGADVNNNYILQLKGASRSDTITDLTVKEGICSKCMGKVNSYYYMDGFRLNGTPFSGVDVAIHK